MGIVEMSKRLKEEYPQCVILFKSGTFYKVFGQDAYILSAMFNYNIQIGNQNVTTCGFPISSEKRILDKLEENKINYKTINPKDDYSIEKEANYESFNNYKNEFKKDFNYIKQKNRICKISEELELYIDSPNFKEIIRKIEDILDEKAKI